MERTCLLDDCVKRVVAQGRCSTHYAAYRRAGGKVLSRPTVCSYEDCGEKVKARGLCSRHYNRDRLLGDGFAGARTCRIDGCDRPVCGDDLCRAHYKKRARHGDPLTPDRPNVVRNRVHVDDDGVGILVMTRRDGATSTARFDAADLDVVVSHHWGCVGGYAVSSADGFVSLHRLLLGLSKLDPGLGDHIDGDTLNNRRSNLRVVDSFGNGANRARISNRGRSRYRGVHWRERPPHWRARFADVHLGYFATEEEAAAVVDAYRTDIGKPGYG